MARSGGISQQAGSARIAAMSDGEFRRLLSLQQTQTQRDVLLRMRPGFVPSIGATPRSRAVARDAAAAQRARDAAAKTARIAAIPPAPPGGGREQITGREKANILSRRGIIPAAAQQARARNVARDKAAAEAQALAAAEATAAEAFRLASIQVTSPVSPVPGISRGGVEAITGQQMQDILTAAGIPFTSQADNPNVSAKSAIDPYAVFFS